MCGGGWLLLACWLLLLVASADAESGWLIEALHKGAPRFTFNLERAPPHFRPTHTDYQMSLLVLAVVGVAAGVIALCVGGCAGGLWSCVAARLKTARQCHQKAATTAAFVLLTITLLVGMVVSGVAIRASQEVDALLQPLQIIHGRVADGIEVAHGLSIDSEAAYPNAIKLRELALALVPHIDALQQHADRLLDLLRQFTIARVLDAELAKLPSKSVREIPAFFSVLRQHLKRLNTELLTPIQLPLTSLKKEISALQEVVDLQQVNEVQFGLFFFMSLESSLLADTQYEQLLVQWLNDVEEQARGPLLVSELQLVDAILNHQDQLAPSIVSQARGLQKTYLQEGRAIDAIGPVQALLRMLSYSPVGQGGAPVKQAAQRLSHELAQPLSPSVPPAARQLANGVAFLEDRSSIDRVKANMIDKQMNSYHSQLAQVHSPSADAFLGQWRKLNAQLADQVPAAKARWAAYSTHWDDARQQLDSYSTLWFVCGHMETVLLLGALIVAYWASTSRRLLWGVVTLLLLVVAGTWNSVEMSLYLPVSVVVADWCMEPETSLVSLLLEQPRLVQEIKRVTDSTTADVANYYLKCRGEGPFAHQLSSAREKIEAATTQMAPLKNVSLLLAPSVKNTTTSIWSALQNTRRRLVDVEGLANCTTVSEPYAQFKSVACGAFLQDSVALLLGRVVLALLLSLSLFSVIIAAATTTTGGKRAYRPRLSHDEMGGVPLVPLLPAAALPQSEGDGRAPTSSSSLADV